MQLNPTVRWLLAGLLGAATAAVTILSDGFQPLDALLIVIALGGSLGLAPPQIGGTQQGIVNPSITEPPEADVHPEGQRGLTTVELIGILCLIGIAVLIAALVL